MFKLEHCFSGKVSCRELSTISVTLFPSERGEAKVFVLFCCLSTELSSTFSDGGAQEHQHGTLKQMHRIRMGPADYHLYCAVLVREFYKFITSLCHYIPVGSLLNTEVLKVAHWLRMSATVHRCATDLECTV